MTFQLACQSFFSGVLGGLLGYWLYERIQGWWIKRRAARQAHEWERSQRYEEVPVSGPRDQHIRLRNALQIHTGFDHDD